MCKGNDNNRKKVKKNTNSTNKELIIVLAKNYNIQVKYTMISQTYNIGNKRYKTNIVKQRQPIYGVCLSYLWYAKKKWVP